MLPSFSLAEFHDILRVSGFTIVHWTTQTEVTEVCLYCCHFTCGISTAATVMFL